MSSEQKLPVGWQILLHQLQKEAKETCGGRLIQIPVSDTATEEEIETELRKAAMANEKHTLIVAVNPALDTTYSIVRTGKTGTKMTIHKEISFVRSNVTPFVEGRRKMVQWIVAAPRAKFDKWYLIPEEYFSGTTELSGCSDDEKHIIPTLDKWNLDEQKDFNFYMDLFYEAPGVIEIEDKYIQKTKTDKWKIVATVYSRDEDY